MSITEDLSRNRAIYRRLFSHQAGDQAEGSELQLPEHAGISSEAMAAASGESHSLGDYWLTAQPRPFPLTGEGAQPEALPGSAGAPADQDGFISLLVRRLESGARSYSQDMWEE